MNTIDLDKCCAEVLSFSIEDKGKVTLEVLLSFKGKKSAKLLELCFYLLDSTKMRVSGSPWMKKITGIKLDDQQIGFPVDDSIIDEHSPHIFYVILEANCYFEIVANRFFSIVKKEINRR